MKVILIEEEAFFELIDRVVARIGTRLQRKEKSWLTPDEAKKALGISSATTLQKYRDEGRIRFTQISKKVILYDPKSIEDYLNSKAQNPF